MKQYNYSDYDPDAMDHDVSTSQTQVEDAEAERQPRKKRTDRSTKIHVENKRGADYAEDANDGFVARCIDFLTMKRTRIVFGIALILLSGWFTIAALSFLKSGGADQSEVVSSTVSELASNPDSIDNISGPAGAEASHHMFVEGFGFGSIVIIAFIVIVALGLLGVRKIHFWRLTFKSLILTITISLVLGLVTLNSTAIIPAGGYHGRYINILLISSIGWIGAILVSCLMVSIVVTIYINELASLYNRYKVKMRTLRDRRIMEEDRKKYVEERVEDAMADTPMSVQMVASDNVDHNISVEELAEEDGPVVTITDSDTIDINLDDELNRELTDIEPAQTDRENVSSPDESEPGFEISHEKEIEQGKGLPDRVKAEGPYDPRADLSGYRMPPLSLMMDRPRKTNSVDLTEQEENKERITATLAQYNIRIDKIKATVGPTVTLYEIVPAEGVRIASIKRLEDDIAMSLAALGIRIIAPIPGKGTIGIEVPNKDPQTVSIRSILGSKAFQETRCELPMAIGATIANDVYIADLAKMPHLLVAGATGQGKSVGLNAIIASLLYKKHPAELKFVLVDPKMVEFSLYACLEKHYLAKLPDEVEPVVTDPNKVVDTLNSLCKEMDDRYSLLRDAGCRTVIEYNTKFINRRLNPEKGHRYMPYIVMIVDEFADLIMMAGKAVETPIARIAQKARAVGMHMIIATQRPSTNVITGLIKANFPARIGFRVTQMVDSRTILDSPGANQLIGRGDMLISHNGTMERVQCAFIDTPEVEALCAHIRDQIGYPTAYILPEPPIEGGDDSGVSISSNPSERDPLLEEVGRWIVQGNTASTSSVQRRYSIGFNRAGKIMDQLERLGVVDKAQGGKPRRVLVDPVTLEDILSIHS